MSNEIQLQLCDIKATEEMRILTKSKSPPSSSCPPRPSKRGLGSAQMAGLPTEKSA